MNGPTVVSPPALPTFPAIPVPFAPTVPVTVPPGVTVKGTSMQNSPLPPPDLLFAADACPHPAPPAPVAVMQMLLTPAGTLNVNAPEAVNSCD
jgi:hypothetical protein